MSYKYKYKESKKRLLKKIEDVTLKELSATFPHLYFEVKHEIIDNGLEIELLYKPLNKKDRTIEKHIENFEKLQEKCNELFSLEELMQFSIVEDFLNEIKL